MSLPCSAALKLLKDSNFGYIRELQRFCSHDNCIYNTCLAPKGVGACHADPVTPSVLHFQKEETEGAGGLVPGHSELLARLTIPSPGLCLPILLGQDPVLSVCAVCPCWMPQLHSAPKLSHYQ